MAIPLDPRAEKIDVNGKAGQVLLWPNDQGKWGRRDF